MKQTQVSEANLSIQWVNKNENKYLVKFEKIDVPIEMNEKYFKSIMKHLEN